MQAGLQAAAEAQAPSQRGRPCENEDCDHGKPLLHRNKKKCGCGWINRDPDPQNTSFKLARGDPDAAEEVADPEGVPASEGGSLSLFRPGPGFHPPAEARAQLPRAAAPAAFDDQPDSIDAAEEFYPGVVVLSFAERNLCQLLADKDIAHGEEPALKYWETILGRQRNFVLSYASCRNLGRELNHVTERTLQFVQDLIKRRDTTKQLIIKLGITNEPSRRAAEEYKKHYDRMDVLFSVDAEIQQRRAGAGLLAPNEPAGFAKSLPEFIARCGLNGEFADAAEAALNHLGVGKEEDLALVKADEWEGLKLPPVTVRKLRSGLDCKRGSACALAQLAEKDMIRPFTLYRSVPRGVTVMNVAEGASSGRGLFR